MGLTNHTWPISCHWLLMVLGADTQTQTHTLAHTHTHTDVQTKTILKNQLRATQAWFKKDIHEICIP